MDELAKILADSPSESIDATRFDEIFEQVVKQKESMKRKLEETKPSDYSYDDAAVQDAPIRKKTDKGEQKV